MAPKASTRILKELKEFSEDPCGMTLDFKENSVTELRGEITGPLGTAYEGGRFVLDILLPKNYPFSPPVVKFATKVWHPFVDSKSGEIAVDILSHGWAAAVTLRTVMLSLQTCLAVPDSINALDAVVAKQCKYNYELFEQTARHWTNVYAGGSNREPELEQKIEEMKTMGFEKNKSRIALSNNNWVINDAITSIATR